MKFTEQDLLKYLAYVLLTLYSLFFVNTLDVTHFENIYVRLGLIIVVVLSAQWDPVVCLLMAIGFLVTHQRLQELKKKQTNTKIELIQIKEDKKLENLKELNKKLKEKNSQLNTIVNNKIVDMNQSFNIKNTSDDKELTQDEIDEKYNYMTKETVYNAVVDVNNYFEVEDSFDKISNNMV
tara:strand:+ start:6825 stop:7364 length:540 start_codon:yes stop_codon:yes gene_type:complete